MGCATHNFLNIVNILKKISVTYSQTITTVVNVKLHSNLHTQFMQVSR